MKKLFSVLTLLLLSFMMANGQGTENLKIAWPGEYKWKVASNQQTSAANMIELIPGAETLNSWTIMATMMSYKNMRVPSISKVPPMLFTTTQKNAPLAKLTVLENGVKAGRQWTIFKIESPSFKNSPAPESQLYYAIQGDRTLYVSFVAVKAKWIPTVFVFKWTNVFKSSQLVKQ
ncbi:hypothetical protein DYU05_04535 [Mucilaginibacter terrenus]|uniref:Uncharacterized protein n=1 Tax=Mucilaginibacter terrenus TaxID=2482727 RepID=A0A3E2NV42_9SPHI|nr:hypothetical protein [Mucilaginibacter terrenus]RFZ84878.1 hypothetical protein DYU05_04535 [Mucilaginibacter terrenus]